MLVLTACSPTVKNITPITKGITFSCEATYYNEIYECEVTVQKNGDTQITFKKPVEIESLTYSFSSNGVSAKLNDVEYINDKKVFEKSVANFIYEVMINSNTDVFSEDDVFYTEDKAAGYEYKMQIGQSGLPIKIITNSQAIIVIIKNAKIN